jgi:hypothetical protein
MKTRTMLLAAIALCASMIGALPARADGYAEFFINPAGQVTGSINGSPLTLPTSFAIVMGSFDDPEHPGQTLFSMYSCTATPNSYSDLWVGGRVLTTDFHGFSGLVGYFSTISYPGPVPPEPVLMRLVIDGHPMIDFTGEPVRVDVVGEDTRVRLGRPPPLSFDLYTFLDAWFSGALEADINADGVLSVQDLFDFLAGWFGP